MMKPQQEPQSAAEYIESQEYSFRIRLAELGFKVMFKLFGIVAALLGRLTLSKDKS